MASLRELLLRGTEGLVTLTGPAGTGKTRLALAVAAELRNEFADGICFVALASVAEPELVVSSIVRRLGLQEAGGASLEATLFGHLRQRHMLLVLDNFEHLLDSATIVAELLSTCPRLKILATSRAPLHLYGERDFPVPPLPLPEKDHIPANPAEGDYPAITLFADRAAAVRPDFRVTSDNVAAVVAICKRLDGLPLAIELAAARAGVLTPQAMLARLLGPDSQPSLNLLTTGPRDAPERHKTLRDAIGSSHDLLGEDVRPLFRRLAVFMGDFSLEAAAAITSSTPLDVSPASLNPPPRHASPSFLDTVSTLAENSLLQPRADRSDGEACFSMLETIREYALEQLQAHGELESTRWRHARYYLLLAEEGERQAGGPRQTEWLGRLDEEHANLRAALAWSLAPDSADPLLGARLAAALWVFWFRRAYLREGTRWVQQALSAAGDMPPLLRAKLLTADGSLARMLGEFTRAQTALEHGAHLSREIGDREGLAWSLSHLGLVKQWLGDLDTGVTVLEESLNLRRELGDERGIARSLFNLAVAEDFRCNYHRASELYEQTLEVQRLLGDVWGIGRVSGYLAKVALVRGESSRAATLSAEALDLCGRVGDTWGVGLAHACRAGVAWAHADLNAAGTLLKQSLVSFRDVGSRDRIAECLQDLASLACLQGSVQQAVRLSAAAEATQHRIGLALWPAVSERRDQDMRTARAQLGDDAFDRAWSAGLSMSIEQAIDDAMTVQGRAEADLPLSG
ncbi:MAG: tetratricopeptide repeat protein [Chloroflexota bacterium]